MCGRTGLTLNKYQLQCACSYKNKNDDKFIKPEWLNEYNNGKEYKPSHNIAPTDITPVLVSGSRFKNAAKTDRILKPMMWGIIPPWHKGDYRGHQLSTNNCRLENIKSSNLYAPILREGGRCIIVVEGFYEWQTTTINSKVKKPYYIYSLQEKNVKIDDPQTWNNNFKEESGWTGVKLLYMAGLYNIWKNNNVIIYSYSIITMESNSTLNWLHHRMPAILDSEEKINAWLNIDDVSSDMALAYLKPVQVISWHPVSTSVNNSKNKSLDCNKRIDTTNKSTQKMLTAYFEQDSKRKSSNIDNTCYKKVKL